MTKTQTTYNAQYARTRNGNWGVRITGEMIDHALPGDQIEVNVQRRNGEINSHTVNIFWTGENRFDTGKVALASIVSADTLPITNPSYKEEYPAQL